MSAFFNSEIQKRNNAINTNLITWVIIKIELWLNSIMQTEGSVGILYDVKYFTTKAPISTKPPSPTVITCFCCKGLIVFSQLKVC